MWRFLSRSRGETEGYSNGSLAEFKGNPLQALAREICQNSLNAADGSGKPVIVEFQSTFMDIDSFPGMGSMRDVINACDEFWKGKGDVNTITFLRNAKRALSTKSGKFFLLRVSDFNLDSQILGYHKLLVYGTPIMEKYPQMSIFDL